MQFFTMSKELILNLYDDLYTGFITPIKMGH